MFGVRALLSKEGLCAARTGVAMQPAKDALSLHDTRARAGLGLGALSASQLLPQPSSSGDLEATGGARAPRARPYVPGFASNAAARVIAGARGIVPLRVWLLGGYLLLLHVVVMVGFTRKHEAIHQLCGGAAARHTQLP